MKRWLLLSGAVLLLVGLVLYGRTLHYEFVELDDPLLITENPAMQSLTWPHVKTFFTTYDPELYIPLTLLSYQIDIVLGGMHPFLIHLHTLLEHILNAGLLLILVYQLTNNRWVSLFTALLFLIHPINTEAVIWASGRKDVLSATFFLVALIFSIQHKRKFLSVSILAFLLGLLSKVTVVSLPFVLFIIDWIEGRSITRKSLLEKLPYFILAVAFGIVALFGKSGAPSLSLMTRILVATKSLVFAVQKVLVPTGLSPMYAYTGPITTTNPAFVIPLIGVTGVLVGAFLLRKRIPVLTAAIFFVVLTFAPSFANLVKNGEYYLTSDRYAYIPAMAIFLMTGLLLQKLSVKLPRGIIHAIAIVILLTYASVTFAQTRVWSDTQRLSAYVVQVSPDARLGHMWYGNALRDHGQIDQALLQYDAALEMKEDAQVLYNRALALEIDDQPKAAQEDYERALSLDPSYALAHINLGRLLYLQEKKDEARAHFESAKHFASQLAMPFFDLGVLEGEQKHWDKAIEYYRGALERDPSLSDARANLAIGLLSIGRTAEAVDELKKTLLEDPENPTANAALAKLINDGIVKTSK